MRGVDRDRLRVTPLGAEGPLISRSSCVCAVAHASVAVPCALSIGKWTLCYASVSQRCASARHVGDVYADRRRVNRSLAGGPAMVCQSPTTIPLQLHRWVASLHAELTHLPLMVTVNVVGCGTTLAPSFPSSVGPITPCHSDETQKFPPWLCDETRNRNLPITRPRGLGCWREDLLPSSLVCVRHSWEANVPS